MEKFYLHKEWTLKPVSITSSPTGVPFPDEGIPATIPGTVHTDLLMHDLIEDPFYADNEEQLQWIHNVDWVYHTFFTPPSDFSLDRPIHLVCEGLDTLAEIVLNEKLLVQTRNMFRTYRLAVSSYILPKNNKLTVTFRSPTKWCNEQAKKRGEMENSYFSNRVYLRKAQYSYGWDWGPSFPAMGIWRPIYLIQPDVAWVESVRFETVNVQKSWAQIKIHVKIQGHISEVSKVKVSLGDEDRKIERDIEDLASHDIQIDLKLAEPRLWWPRGQGESYLYHLKVELFIKENQLVDEWNKKVGIRTIELQTKESGNPAFKFLINDKPVYMKGANWIPTDSFIPRASNEKYSELLKMFVNANMNMIRVWGGGIYENDYFYQLCDQLGILVWQDFMFACGIYPEDQEFLQNVKEEVRQNVSRLQFHPSLAIWCGNNENEWSWAFDGKREINKMPGFQIYHEIIPKILKNLDPTRPYWPSSPFGDDQDPNDPTTGNRHQWDIWSDWEDFSQIHSDESHFVTEFGFQAPANLHTMESVIPVEQRYPQSRLFEYHNKQVEGNERLFRFLAGHFPVKNEWEDFIYLTQLNQAIALKTCVDHWRSRWPNTAGSIVWQYNDCWPVTSWSLIDYLHRPKISYYFTKNAFAPVFTLFEKRDQIIDILIHNQDINEFSGFLNIYILDNIYGQLMSQNSIPVSLAPESKEKFHQFDLSEYSHHDWTILLRLVSKDSRLTHRNYYTEGRWKHKKLPKNQIKLNVINAASGTRIELSTDKAGYFVDLYHPDYQFADRGIMLLPGEKRQLKIVSNGTGKIELNKIKIFSLNRYLSK